ncbi:hypothetical protein [Shewanella sp. AC34-MNA-CIBAN-0136]|uniref:hypothetical protein n=1 Tax=Shewanella sp. AC34-MNA-CIBAN-0136 TaxID=3140463 RepID=UPI00331954AC
MKVTFIKYIPLIYTFLAVSNIAYATDRVSLSTSRFVEVDYYSDGKSRIKTCSGKQASFAQNYVSISINKLTVNKNDSLIKRVFNKNRNAFGVSNLKGEYQSQPISISRVGHPVAIKGGNSSVDMGVEWGMLDRVPWVLKNASLEIKLGYAADSTTESLAEAFNSITAVIPDYTISTSMASGVAIASTIDKLLFGADRAIDLLNVHRDLPLLANRLCEGYYAIFAAENNDVYEKYYQGDVIWMGNDLEYKGKPINDVSYAVISVRVSDQYYEAVESSINDNSRAWASKYRDTQTSFFDLLWVSDKNTLGELTRNIKNNLIEARALLSSDINLIQKEKISIHQFFIDDFNKKLEIANERLDKNGKVTALSTENALENAIINPNVTFLPENTRMAQILLSNPSANIPSVEAGFDKEFIKAIKGTQGVLGLK